MKPFINLDDHIVKKDEIKTPFYISRDSDGYYLYIYLLSGEVILDKSFNSKISAQRELDRILKELNR